MVFSCLVNAPLGLSVTIIGPSVWLLKCEVLLFKVVMKVKLCLAFLPYFVIYLSETEDILIQD